ncbi:MAG: hypothetical protein Q9222_003456 [Ikaeria aurantiellina]
MLADQAYQIWYNEPVPVPAETYTECYAPEFITSYLKSLGGATVPAFSPLLCQHDYSTVFSSFSGTATYIACCPTYAELSSIHVAHYLLIQYRGFSFHPPENPAVTRPAFGGTCFINITSTVVQYYDSSSFVSTTAITNTVGVLQGYAHPIDGFAMSTYQDLYSSALAGASSVVQDVEGSGAVVATSQSAAVTTQPIESSELSMQAIASSVTLKGSVSDTATVTGPDETSKSQYTHRRETDPAAKAAATATSARTTATPDPTHVSLNLGSVFSVYVIDLQAIRRQIPHYRSIKLLDSLRDWVGE